MHGRIRILLILFFCGFFSAVKAGNDCKKKVDSLLKAVELNIFQFPDSTKVILDECLSNTRNCNYTHGEVKALNWIGLYHQNTGDYQSATRYYFQSLEMAEEYGYQKDQGVVQNNLGALYFDLQDFITSKEYYQLALTEFQNLEDTAWLSKVYGNVAGVYFMSQEYDSCITMLESSIRLAIASDRFEAVGGAMANLAMVHFSLNNPEAAFAAYDHGIHLLDSVGDVRGVCIAMEMKAKSQKEHQLISEAIVTYQTAIDKAKKVKYIEGVVKCSKGLSDLYKDQQDHFLALGYLEIYSFWKDSLLNQDKINSINELNKKYQTEKKEEEIMFLTKEGKLKDELVEKNKKEKNYVLLLAILMFLVIVLVVIQLRQKLKLNKALIDKNTLTEQSLKERETLVKEIHHRVKNNLQIVASMLNIQANSLDDAQVKEALLESRKRVQSMSLVHQKLYRTDNVQKVALKEYIEHVLEEVEAYYDLNVDGVIEVEKCIANINLHVDKAIPLGLILTELVSNSYKHGFNNKANGTIRVLVEEENETIHVEVSDNGKGSDEQVFQNSKSFGTKLIFSLCRSLNCAPEWKSRSGTIVMFTFKL